MSIDTPFRVETSILNSILIDCCVVFLQENSSEEKILGSGTLVSIHDKKAILTADHVLEKIEQPSGCGRLFFPTRFDNSPQSTPRASTLLGETYPTTHDLARLVAMLRERDVEATRFNELVEYTPFAVQFRYAPGDLSARPLDRDTAIERVEALLKEVRQQSDNMSAF